MGVGHTCVVFDSGAAKCWGAGWSGSLGQGNVVAIGDDETPAAIDPIDVGDGVTALDGGSAFTCAVTTSEDVRCWGDNDFGQLALGNTSDIGDDELPSAVGPATLALGSVVHVSTGDRNACATYDSGDVACWGPSGFGEHGYGSYETIGDDEAVSTAGFVSIGGPVVQTAVGSGHACGLLESQEVVCWGYNSDGRLGYGFVSLGIGDDELPSSAGPVDVGGFVDAITAGDSHTCALFTGFVRCWGSNGRGQLGYPSTSYIGDDDTPIAFGPVDIEFPITTPTVQIVAGSQHTCALLADGRVRCWGANTVGQLGYGNTDDVGDDELPSEIGDVDVGGTVTRLAAGGDRTCALFDTGGVRCWGSGFGGLLGYGDTATIGDDEPPSAVGELDLF